MIEVLAPVASTASRTVLKTGTPCTSCPPRPGVTPATTLVPYSSICCVWKLPSRPVIPWTTRRVFALTRMLTMPPFRARSAERGARNTGERPTNGSIGTCSAFRAPRSAFPCGGDDRLGGLVQRVGGDQVDARLAQDAAALLLVGALQAHHQRHGDADLPDALDDALGDDVAAGDAAEDVEEDGLDVGVGHDQPQCGGDLVGAGAAADVEEVGRRAAVELDRVHRRHREAGAVDQAADLAVELDEGESERARLQLRRVLLARVAQALDPLV